MEKKGLPDSGFLLESYPLTPEERAAVLAKLKADFSAADLQRLTEVEEDIPMERVIREVEELHQRRSQKTK